MKAIVIVLLVSCAAFRYEDGTYYRQRNGRINRLSKTTFGVVPFRPPRGLGRRRFENRFPMRQDTDKYYRARSDNSSVHHNTTTTHPLPPTPSTEMPLVQPAHPNSSLGVYGYIQNMQYKADRMNDNNYKWIARVVPTFKNVKFAPMLCNTACIEARIFLTTAHCIFNAKVLYTRVYYQNEDLQPIAFVLPSKPSKQMFYDLGLIVVNNNFTKTWEFIAIRQFKWINDEILLQSNTSNIYIHVIGHVGELMNDLPTSEIQMEYTLYSLFGAINNDLCNYLLNKVYPNDAYFVPCYHRCTLTHNYQMIEPGMAHGVDLSRCLEYLAGEGHILIDQSSPPQLIGVATWGVQYKSDFGLDQPRLPVGITIPNSPAFLEDLACAQKIKAAPHTSERFDTICN